MRRNLLKLAAFLTRDFLSDVSYRLSFFMNIGGIVFSLLAFYYLTRMIDPQAAGLDGMRPFEWMLVGLAFQFYFTAALYSFSARIRSEQVLGTLEAMLVSPTPTSIVIFSSAAWDFAYGAIRVLLYLGFAALLFGVRLQFGSPLALGLGLVLTLLSSAGLGILSASFVIYFKRGDPVNFLLSGANTFLGTVFFPVEQLPAWLRPASQYLPITWSLRIVRGTLLQGHTLAEMSGELLRLAGMTALLLPLGLVAARYAIRRAKREGSLIVY